MKNEDAARPTGEATHVHNFDANGICVTGGCGVTVQFTHNHSAGTDYCAECTRREEAGKDWDADKDWIEGKHELDEAERVSSPRSAEARWISADQPPSQPGEYWVCVNLSSGLRRGDIAYWRDGWKLHYGSAVIAEVTHWACIELPALPGQPSPAPQTHFVTEATEDEKKRDCCGDRYACNYRYRCSCGRLACESHMESHLLKVALSGPSHPKNPEPLPGQDSKEYWDNLNSQPSEGPPYWQCPNNERHYLKFGEKIYGTQQYRQYCMHCPDTIAVFRPKPKETESAAEPSEGLEQVGPDDYVAWLHFVRHGKLTIIQVCDSDSKGAFKVYRWPDVARHFSGGKGAAIDELRNQDWYIAVHNDYRLNGKRMTFYLLTHDDGRWVKGEGATDTDALLEINQKLAALSGGSEGPRQMRIDIGNLLAELDAHQNNTGHFLEEDDAAIVEDIRSRHHPISESNGEPKEPA